MTEVQLFEQCIPQIAEIIVELRKMTPKEYYEWKNQFIQSIPENAMSFMEKIFLVIEEYLPETKE